MKQLPIYYQGEQIATLLQDAHGQLELEYTASWQRKGFEISVTLPRSSRRHTGSAVRTYFENILPEGVIRETLALQYGTDQSNVYALLQHIGQDCAGAFSIGGPGSKGDYTELTPESIQTLLNKLPQFPMATSEGQTSLSLAGAQHKLPLFLKDGIFYLPRSGAASNCIVKLPIRGFSHTVENEHFCLELAKHISLPVVQSHILQLPEYTVLVVERYDRKGSDFHPERLPQEDFCQMSNRSSAIKYEKDGGPSFTECATLIREHSAQPGMDLILLVKWAAFNCCVGNNDAHAKNISMIRQAEHLKLAPFYDLLSTTYYGNRLLRRQAMYVGRKNKSFFVSRRRWEQLAQDISLPAKTVLNHVKQVARNIISSLEEVEVIAQNNGVPPQTASHLAHHIQTRTTRILEALEAT
ncbi:MAG: type II toxin-antitoxin system HipA family toxin [Akkermansia sp.]|nr:type II toxin-antitoxin system HipA family toxin [Akkermansia sp.]